jgi:NADH:ubiquinone oxidoreductase subunit K
MIRILIALELLTKAVTLLMIAVGYLTGWNTINQSFVITLIIIEIVVIVVSCGILLGVYRHNETLNTQKLKNLKG